MTARRASRMSRRERQLRAAAFHEAGHAVAAYHLHVRLRRISIGADEGDALGWLDLWLPHVTRDQADNIRQAQAVERDIIVLLAGAQAERVGLGRSSCPAGGVDFYEAMPPSRSDLPHQRGDKRLPTLAAAPDSRAGAELDVA